MEKITNPQIIKSNLIIASLFVTSFEMLKTSIQDRIKSFLCLNATLNKQVEMEHEISTEYKTNVLERAIPSIDRRKSRDYHLFYSSCLWLKDNNVINQNDIVDIEQIRKHRNLIAHNPVKLLVDDNTNINIALLKKSQTLLSKIEKWWIIEFEIPVNPDFDGKIIDENEVQSGTTVFLDYLMEIANDEINKE